MLNLIRYHSSLSQYNERPECVEKCSFELDRRMLLIHRQAWSRSQAEVQRTQASQFQHLTKIHLQSVQYRTMFNNTIKMYANV